jgi:hypothetical protein
MNRIVTPERTDIGWIIEIPVELTSAMGVAEGSIAVLHPAGNTISVEVLPPATVDLESSVSRIYDKYKDAFAEMKRLGD